MLIINNLSVSFDSKKVLDTISLSIPKGSIALFLGSSGVGKSTLLRVLNTLQKSDQGSVTLDHQALNLTPGTYNPHVGMVFQHFNLFEHLSVLDNISLSLTTTKNISSDQAHLKAQKLLEDYGLADKSHCYPAQLSGGQKQRVALARSLALDPTVLCLDEPTSALDPQLSRHIAQQMNTLAQQGYIILIASHDTSLLEHLECTIHLMQDGKIIQSASAQAFKDHPEQYTYINKFVKQH